MMNTQLFYPSCFGMTKQEVVRMMKQRIDDELIPAGQIMDYPDSELIFLITNERMQHFTDAWGDLIFVGIDADSTMAQPLMEQEALLKALAHDLNQLLGATQTK